MVRAGLLLLGVIAMTSWYGCKQRSQVTSSVRDTGDFLLNYSGDGLKSWADGTTDVTDWDAEFQLREQVVSRYLELEDPAISQQMGFKQGHNPKLGWLWFEESPVGFGGVPFVILKTILDLDARSCAQYDLCKLHDIWKKSPLIGQGEANIDHIGFAPHRRDYVGGFAKAPENRDWRMPYGFVFQGGKAKYLGDYARSPYQDSIENLKDATYESAEEQQLLVGNDDQKIAALKTALTQRLQKVTGILAGIKTGQLNADQLIAKLEKETESSANKPQLDPNRPSHEQHYNEPYKTFGRSDGFDRVFFSCAGCHVGRVAKTDSQGRTQVIHLPGAPNTEVEAQYFSQLLMETGALLGGLNLRPKQLILPTGSVPNVEMIAGLYKAMVEKAIQQPESLYGDSKEAMVRGLLMVNRIAGNFPAVLNDVIGTAIKTHYIYIAIASKYGYNAERLQKLGILQPGQKAPDVLNDRIGQMDAFGIASGLVALHLIRPDGSFAKFLTADEYGVMGEAPGKSHFLTGFPYFDRTFPLLGMDLTAPDFTPLAANPEMAKLMALNGITDPANVPMEKRVELAAKRVFASAEAWAPPVPAPIDIKTLSFSKDKYYANWDGNQGANARALASGTSATGDPRRVNTEIHETANPFINYMPPRPYQFGVDIAKATRGRDLFNRPLQIAGNANQQFACAGCHKPNNERIFTPEDLKGVDPLRTLVNTSVSRNLLVGMVVEACSFFNRSSGSDWCIPPGASQKEKILDTFADTPKRVECSKPGNNVADCEKKAGYKADMLHSIWSSAPYLHNGSVPTLAHLICPSARPKKFIRGNIFYDSMLVGFEWAAPPQKRYGQHDTVNFKWFDTEVLSRGNGGHPFGSSLCPNDEIDRIVAGNEDNKIAKRDEITQAILNSEVGDLLEYLKTL